MEIDKYFHMYGTKDNILFKEVEKPERRWIPCSERLPEKPNMYEVTDSKGDVVRFVFCNTESSREYWRRCAKAWMPLPEPYEEDDRICINADEIHGSVLKTIPIFEEDTNDKRRSNQHP